MLQPFSALSIFRGTVSNVNHSSTTTGHISGVSTNYVGDRAYVSGGGGSISTTHATTFRVDGKPISWSGNLEIADGDKVSVAVWQGGSSGVVLVNDTSKNVNWPTSDSFFEMPKIAGKSRAPLVILIIIAIW